MGWPAGDFVLVLSVDFGWDVFGGGCAMQMRRGQRFGSVVILVVGAGLGFAWVRATTTFGGDLVQRRGQGERIVSSWRVDRGNDNDALPSTTVCG